MLNWLLSLALNATCPWSSHWYDARINSFMSTKLNISLPHSISEKVFLAEVQEKKQAQETYNEAVSKGQSAGKK